MNKKIIIPFVLVVVLLLVLPVLVQAARFTGIAPPPAPTAPVDKSAPPLLDANNLVGTAWSVRTPEIPVAITISLNAGGRAIATVPAGLGFLARQQFGTDTFTGQWSVSGTQVIASVTFQGNTRTVACDIVGDRLFYDNTEIRRLY